ncbi:MAG: hypothetical protein ACI93R_004179 [Flavobacteriales bacterium]|jgi:hypothetical protein
MKTNLKHLLLLLITSHLFSCSSTENSTYVQSTSGMPVDQVIPGRLQCEFYDTGGEGVSFSDSYTINSGSGGLNKGSDYFSTFRINEAVDISYSKYFDQIDNSKFNIVDQQENQLYVGWTQPGEWMKYTVDVEESGNYQVGLMFTSRHGGVVRLSTENGEHVDLHVPTTYDQKDPHDWRQWHHWNYIEDLGTLTLKKGKQTLTFTTIEKGEMNYDYIDFKLK